MIFFENRLRAAREQGRCGRVKLLEGKFEFCSGL